MARAVPRPENKPFMSLNNCRQCFPLFSFCLPTLVCAPSTALTLSCVLNCTALTANICATLFVHASLHLDFFYEFFKKKKKSFSFLFCHTLSTLWEIRNLADISSTPPLSPIFLFPSECLSTPPQHVWLRYSSTCNDFLRISISAPKNVSRTFKSCPDKHGKILQKARNLTYLIFHFPSALFFCAKLCEWSPYGPEI